MGNPLYVLSCKDCNTLTNIYWGFYRSGVFAKPYYCVNCNAIEYVYFPKGEKNFKAAQYCNKYGNALKELDISLPEKLFGPCEVNIPLCCFKCKSKNVTLEFSGFWD